MGKASSGIWGEMEAIYLPFTIGFPFAGMVSWLVIWTFGLAQSLDLFVGLTILTWLVFSTNFAVFFWDRYMDLKYTYLTSSNSEEARMKLIRFFEWYLPLVMALAVSFLLMPLVPEEHGLKLVSFAFFALLSFVVSKFILLGAGSLLLERIVKRVFGRREGEGFYVEPVGCCPLDTQPVFVLVLRGLSILQAFSLMIFFHNYPLSTFPYLEYLPYLKKLRKKLVCRIL